MKYFILVLLAGISIPVIPYISFIIVKKICDWIDR